MTETAPAPPGETLEALALLEPLEGLGDRPVDEHPAVFEAVHTSLRAVLNGDRDA